MGLFGGKKKDAAAAASASQPKHELPGSARKSVRRVVPKTGAQPKPAPKVTAAPSQPRPQAPAPAPAEVEDMLAPPLASAPVEVDQLDLGTNPTPTRTSGDKPILASAPPDFTGSLGGARSGPTRTGDQVLLDFLIGKSQLLTPEQGTAVRTKAMADQIALDVAAVQMGIITEDQLVNALTQECWVPHLKVDKYEIRKKALDTVGREDAQHFGVFPVDKLGSLLTLAMVNPLDAEAIRQLEQKTGLDIKKVVATRGEILQAIDKYYGGKVVAVESSRSFTNEAGEMKSPTQMLAKSAPAPEPSIDPILDLGAPEPASKPADIAADIQDIDDLLGGDEIIAPAIIEPVAIKPEEIEAVELAAPAVTAPAPLAEGEFDLGDAPRQDTSALSRPTIEPKPAEAAHPLGRRGTEPRAATARVAAGQAGRNVINLVPVMDEEFKHAITHGKAKVFERWVALQSRNRIVNAVPVEKDVEALLHR